MIIAYAVIGIEAGVITISLWTLARAMSEEHAHLYPFFRTALKSGLAIGSGATVLIITIAWISGLIQL